VIAGDCCEHEGAIRDLDEWFGEQPHPIKILVPGNNDFPFLNSSGRDLVKHAFLLINESLTAVGLKIWGRP
jgi:hypothetical protein